MFNKDPFKLFEKEIKEAEEKYLTMNLSPQDFMKRMDEEMDRAENKYEVRNIEKTITWNKYQFYIGAFGVIWCGFLVISYFFRYAGMDLIYSVLIQSTFTICNYISAYIAYKRICKLKINLVKACLK